MCPPLVCFRCGEYYGDETRVRCACGEPLWFDTPSTDFTWADCSDVESIWRYEELLPIEQPNGVARAAGRTPLVRSYGLDGAAGCRVYVKDESENPTGAYKDRGSAVAVPHAIEAGTDVIGTISYGNMAISTAAHATSLDRECIVLVPEETPSARLELIAQYEPTIVQVSGDYGALYADGLSLSDSLPISILVSDAPARISGYKTVVFEIYESLAPDTPDAIVLPTSSGGFASGIWRGLRDLVTLGLLEELPRLYLVQTATADPITQAFEMGATDITALTADETGETIAHSLGNPDPPSGARALAAVRETNGAVVSVTDAEIQTAQRQFAVTGGFCVEPAAATPLAGLTQLSERGVIASDESAVIVPTGTGFKEATGDASISTERTSRADLPSLLDSLLAAH
nr:threonine synthase [Halobellus captivus]